MLKISIFGIGNFGFAILKHLDNKQLVYNHKYFELYAHDRNNRLIENLNKNKKHLLHHKNIRIGDTIVFTKDIHQLIANTDILILAVTSDAIREVISKLKYFINKDLIILNTAKALDKRTGKRCSEIIKDELIGIKYNCFLAMLSGGTIAEDLFNHEPLGVDIASSDETTLKILKNIFISSNLNVYTTNDLIGVEYASAFKNVLSIFSGIVEGLGFSYGSRTHMISRASKEIKTLVVDKLGGLESTFSIESQCWGNDMWMSCTGNTRNREFGILIGKNVNPKDVYMEMKRNNKAIEGMNTVKIIHKLVKNDYSNFPILCSIYNIVYDNANPRKEILKLMSLNTI